MSNLKTVSRSAPVPSLSTSVQYLKGVGPQRAKALARLEITTLGDLLFHFPRSHEDRRFVSDPGRLIPGARAAVLGTVQSFDVASAGRDLLIGRAWLKGTGGPIQALWFRRRSFRFDPFTALKERLVMNASVSVYGVCNRGPRGWEVRVEEFEPGADPTLHLGSWTPIYDLTENIEARWLRGLIHGVVESWAPLLTDPLPEDVRRRTDLLPLSESVRSYHFPASGEDRDRARRRLAFDEFFCLELALARVRGRGADQRGAVVCSPTRVCLTPFRERLGYEFTTGQKTAIAEIFRDMARDVPMRRLLMGDVGSGKTVVAMAALLLAVESGAQGAFLAPTEILAEQHARGLERALAGQSVRWALLTGGTRVAAKKKILAGLKEGTLDLVVGTHALIEGNVIFDRLGLAVIDEQHRFGVNQRAFLMSKGRAPHTLSMTATPIPRTLAMTLYGDTAVSTLRDMPPGRTPVATRLSSEREALDAVRRAVQAGRQAYVVFPLVDASEKIDANAVRVGWEKLKKNVFPDFSIGLIHGRMSSADKDDAMRRFSAGEVQILCATPVIEVGVDVPNATVLVVFNPERFGLAQLHQLRGRVGRGRIASECHLVRSPSVPGVSERLRLVCSESSGFRLAEEDLRLRGPGQLLGEAQHGLPPFRVGRLLEDGPLIETAQEAARRLWAADPELRQPQHHALKTFLEERYGRSSALGHVG